MYRKNVRFSEPCRGPGMRVIKSMHSRFGMESPNVWTDSNTIKLIKAMRIFPILRKTFNKDGVKSKIEKIRLEQLMDCPISEIRRKWGTLRAYYNKIGKLGEAKQKRWRFFEEMAITIGGNEGVIEPSSSSEACPAQVVCFI